MKRFIVLSAAGAVVVLTLGGCVASMAMSAVSMAAEAARGKPSSNEALQPQARDACTRQAQQYGAVHIIDAEQHTISKIIIWGTVDDGKRKRSFQCDYATRVTGFKLRDIPQTPQS